MTRNNLNLTEYQKARYESAIDNMILTKKFINTERMEQSISQLIIHPTDMLRSQIQDAMKQLARWEALLSNPQLNAEHIIKEWLEYKVVTDSNHLILNQFNAIDFTVFNLMSHLLESASTHQFGFKSKLVYQDTQAIIRIYINVQSQFLKLILNDNTWSWAHYMNIDIPLSDLNKLSDDYINMKVDELLRTLSDIMHPNIFIPSLTTTINHVYDVDFKNLIENCQDILGMKLIDYDSFLPNQAYDKFYIMCNQINTEIHKLNKLKMAKTRSDKKELKIYNKKNKSSIDQSVSALIKLQIILSDIIDYTNPQTDSKSSKLYNDLSCNYDRLCYNYIKQYIENVLNIDVKFHIKEHLKSIYIEIKE